MKVCGLGGWVKGECGISSATPGTGRGSPYQIWFRLQPHPSSWWAPLFSESPSVDGVLFSAISSLFSGSLWSPLGSDSSAGFEQRWGAPYVLGVLDRMAWVWWCGLARSGSLNLFHAWTLGMEANSRLADQITVRIVKIVIQATDLVQILYTLQEKKRGLRKISYGRHFPRWPPDGILKCYFLP